MRRNGFLVCAALLLTSCAQNGAVRAALYADLPTLRREVERAEREGKLSRASVADLAEAVARREVSAAEGPSGVRHVRALRACARPLLPVLRERSRRDDEVAAEAMLVRLAQRDISASELLEEHRDAKSGAWRAVAARAALEPRDVVLRRSWFLDPDERVRRAALEAAAAAPDPGDLEAALEAFRLDPDPLSQSWAARVAGAIGGEESVLGLKDRFARADEPARLAIIDAWAMPASSRAGGARQLRSVAESKQGIVSVAAAQALLREGARDGSLVGLLLSAISEGSEAEQRLALVWIPLDDPRVLPAIRLSAKDPNLDVRVIALARWLELPAESKRAIEELRRVAAQDGRSAVAARSALATYGDRSVIGALKTEVKSGHPYRRQQAALALYRLGDARGAAWALADNDVGVRVGAACGVLAAAGG